jgi:hypothetical protein
MRPTCALLVLLIALILGCSRPATVPRTPPPADAPEAPAEPAPAPPSDAPSAPALPPDAADCDRASTPEEVAGTATAPFADVLVQLDIEPTALIIVRPTVGTPFSRVPEFTLFRDGTTIRATDSGVMLGKLTAAEASAFVDRLGQLGAGRLLSHVGRCSCPTVGKDERTSGVCVDDGEKTILRVAVDGKLHHAIVYGNFWNDAAAAHAILEEITRQRPRAEKPYVPKAATLVFFTRPPDAGPPPSCAPLPPSLARAFERPEHGYHIWARAVEGKELAGLSKLLGSDHRTVCLGKDSYVATLYPWLPGMDHHATIKSWQERAATIGGE